MLLIDRRNLYDFEAVIVQIITSIKSYFLQRELISKKSIKTLFIDWTFSTFFLKIKDEN